jgi:hypothetical protein
MTPEHAVVFSYGMGVNNPPQARKGPVPEANRFAHAVQPLLLLRHGDPGDTHPRGRL